jgi:hypothetical protein
LAAKWPKRYIWTNPYDNWISENRRVKGEGFYLLPWGYKLPRTLSLPNAIDLWETGSYIRDDQNNIVSYITTLKFMNPTEFFHRKESDMPFPQTGITQIIELVRIVLGRFTPLDKRIEELPCLVADESGRKMAKTLYVDYRIRLLHYTSRESSGSSAQSEQSELHFNKS